MTGVGVLNHPLQVFLQCLCWETFLDKRVWQTLVTKANQSFEIT